MRKVKSKTILKKKEQSRVKIRYTREPSTYSYKKEP